MTKFCAKYGLYEYKFKAQIMLVELYVATGNLGQAMIVLSQTLA